VRIAGRYLTVVLAIAVAAIVATPIAIWTLVQRPPDRQPSSTPQLSSSVTTDRDAYIAGEPVEIAFVVTNLGPGVVFIQFTSSCQAAYSILLGDSLVYDLRSHIVCYLALTSLTLSPGEARVFRFAWNQTSDAGLPVDGLRSYRIRGSLLPSEPVPGTTAETTILVDRRQAEPNLAYAARMDADEYSSGDLANVTVVLANIGLDTVVMRFYKPCYVQFVVFDETGLAVYNSSKWWGCVSVEHLEILAAGESRSWTIPWDLTADWESPLAAGTYRVVPSFHWVYATSYHPNYQQYVSRTEVATFALSAP
jgi:Intracellular proteinase inhibitor